VLAAFRCAFDIPFALDTDVNAAKVYHAFNSVTNDYLQQNRP
jgi:hypothetical protein